MAEDLTGKTALVTGASSGIGEATAKRLAQAGLRVALVARRKDRLDALTEEIRNMGGQALAIEADVTDAKAMSAALDHIQQQWGGLDILVNNAGVMLLGPVLEAPLEEWQRMLQLNVLALMETSQLAAKAMKERGGGGHIVNISSVAGRTVNAGSAVYNATKHGVNAFTEALRQEMVRDKTNIRTTLIEPGAVQTELQSHIRPEVRDQVKARWEGMEMLQAEDIAEAILYAVSQPQRVSVNEILIRPSQQPG